MKKVEKIGKDERLPYRGFHIYNLHHYQPFFINGKFVHDGFGVSLRGINPMPGACWFQTIKEAKEGIDALLLAGYEIDKEEDKHHKDVGKRFWTIMRTVDGDYISAAVQLKELVESVPEVKKFDFKINLKGEYESYIM